jgi:light-regulated signal transduction histidine kinase (bacteriophytochrome)
MTIAQPSVVAADEDIRLTSCALEPIHRPGAIQPHGALLVVDPESLEIIQASENTADVLGVIAAQLLGTSIDALVGSAFAATKGVLAQGVVLGPSAARPLDDHYRRRSVRPAA